MSCLCLLSLLTGCASAYDLHKPILLLPIVAILSFFHLVAYSNLGTFDFNEYICIELRIIVISFVIV